MSKKERRARARAALDELGIDYPKSGKGSGADALEALLDVATDAVDPELFWWVADHAEEKTAHVPRGVVSYGKKPPKSPPHGGGRWKKRKKPPKWLGDAAKFAATLLVKAVL